MKVKPIGLAVLLDKDCERGNVFILINQTMENIVNRNKRIGNYKYEQLCRGVGGATVLEKRGAKTWHVRENFVFDGKNSHILIG